MSAVNPLQPARRVPGSGPRSRARRKLPYIHSRWNGNYKLPRSANELLTNRLAAYRNREAAHKLAVFLARMNAGPRRIEKKRGPYQVAGFAIDRRVLKNNQELGLTESKIRGAIQTLLKVGFIEIIEIDAKAHHSVIREDGTPGIQRKPIAYRFAGEFQNWFAFLARKPNSPIDTFQDKTPKKEEGRIPGTSEAVPMGEKRVLTFSKPSPVLCKPTEDDPGLMAALARLGLGVVKEKPPEPGMAPGASGCV